MHDAIAQCAVSGREPRRLRIICDDRERGSEVIAELRKLPCTDVVICRMQVGDYLIDGRVLVERKTVHDFVVSLKDGRLFRQVCRPNL